MAKANKTVIYERDDFSEYFYNDNIDSVLAATIDVEENSKLPKNENQVLVVTVYVFLFIIGAVGNLTVFVALVKSRRRKSRVNLMMTHLAVADMIVTFILIPLEIGWRITNRWLGGNFACKILLVLRAFGLYLSSNVLVCISIDRFFAVLYPLRVTLARQRSKIMLFTAWVVAFVCSLPQSYVFRVLKHPEIANFYQCVSFDTFATLKQEQAYNIFCTSAMYFAPLIIITFCYFRIYLEIGKNCKDVTKKKTDSSTESRRTFLRRSDQQLLERARSKTLKMTVTIVCVFFLCGLPYVTMTLWYMFDRESAKDVQPLIQDIFFIMAVSNSCMNPIVYGTYALNFKKGCLDFIAKIFYRNYSANETIHGESKKSENMEVVRKLVSSRRNYVVTRGQPSHDKAFCSVIQSEPPIFNQRENEFKTSCVKNARSLEICCSHK